MTSYENELRMSYNMESERRRMPAFVQEIARNLQWASNACCWEAACSYLRSARELALVHRFRLAH